LCGVAQEAAFHKSEAAPQNSARAKPEKIWVLMTAVFSQEYFVYFKGNTARCGKSRFRENLSSDDGTFLQMYFVYLKKK